MDEQHRNPQRVIDPVEYGRLIQTVSDLNRVVVDLQKEIRVLTALANQGRGAFWAGITLAGVIGSLMGYVAHLLNAGPK